VITGVTVVQGDGSSRLEALGLDRDELRFMTLRALGRTAGFQVPSGEPARGARRCRAGVSILDARLSTKGTTTAEVLVRLEVAPGEDADAISETVRSAESVEPGEAVLAAFRRAIEGGAARAASGLALALTEAQKPDALVIQDLESGDPRLRDLAVRVLADRKNPVAVPALLARLQDPDPDVADRAVGALAQIGDPRAVGPIIELSRRREGPFVAQMVRIVGDIGGAEAEAYLETMLAGHPDPAVASAAREALRDARRKNPDGRGKGAER
jgi:HEAT repeat protein